MNAVSSIAVIVACPLSFAYGKLIVWLIKIRIMTTL